jgi:hypothetical protein
MPTPPKALYVERSDNDLSKLSALKQVFIYVKPGTEERLMYASMTAATRACTQIGGQIEEWRAYDGGDKMQLRCVWTRKQKGASAFEPRWIQHGG